MLVPVYTGDQIRAAEKPLLDSGHGPALMRRAAYGLAQQIAGVLKGAVYGAQITGLIGSGNNGGDGLYALAFLARRGAAARAVLVRQNVHHEALEAFRAAGGQAADAVPAGTQVLIDAVLGTGFRGEFSTPEIPGLAGALNTHHDAAAPPPVVVACDLPSGVNADTGAAGQGVIRADHTVTFGGLKQGLLAGRGGLLSGQLHSVDIGLGEHLPRTPVHWAAGPAQPTGPTAADHKYSRGVVHVVAGSQAYPGAAQLTAGAVLSTGAGMVTLQAPVSVREQVIAVHPEVVGVSGPASSGAVSRASCVVVGPGIGEDPERLEEAEGVLERALETGTACVLDASGLGLIRGQLRRGGGLNKNVLITPHLGEARQLAAVMRDRLLSSMLESASPKADPVEVARRMAGRLDCTVLLKGASTVIASPQGEVVLHRAQAPGLATAGTGDVLSGILGALAASSAGPAGGETPLGPRRGPRSREAPPRVLPDMAPSDTDASVRVPDVRSPDAAAPLGSGAAAPALAPEADWLQVAALGVGMHTAAAKHIDPDGRGRFGASQLITALHTAGDPA
ncbi:NAD(P)H-hydrate dehydratase [Nesterenkonia muleiensis]|uniref:NAD(P)H-hydrate dehydratase n=1 Tax=Nesterenkonia muleiensis TaxID=2282648 RepID=UPI000E77048A|nr:NAD(P)H-hydrate dehydratase [Nesterenkonia muleiensis]